METVFRIGRESEAQQGNSSLPLSPLPQRKKKAIRNKSNRGRRSVQSRLVNPQLSKFDDGWGDSIEDVNYDNLRVVSKNVGGIRLLVHYHKELHLKDWIKQNSVDLIGIQETNINWSLCSERERPLQRFRSLNWELFKGSTSHNKHDRRRSKKFQFGGTMSLAFENTANYVEATGADESGLGRWSWLLLRSLNFSTRFITAYKPIRTPDAKKTRTVYMQHRKYWLRKGIDTDPNILFEQHLLDNIKKWRHNKERIILTIDLNEDVCSADFSSCLSDLGIYSAIRSMHGNFEVPATHQNGSKPIDDIYISSDIRCARSGFCAFGDGPGDHRSIFADLELNTVLGIAPTKIKRPQARRLNSKLPVVVKKFNKVFKEKLFHNHVPERIWSLQNHLQFPLTTDQQLEYEKCDRIKKSAFEFAAGKCRKLRMGNVPFVPEKVQIFGLAIQLWGLIVRYKKGCRVSVKKINGLANFLDIEDPLESTLEYVTEKRADAWRDYKKGKIRAYFERPSWLREKRDKHVAEGNHKAAKDIDTLILNEEMRTAHKRIKIAQDKCNKKGTYQLSIPSVSDPEIMTTVTEKEDLENILMSTNEAKFRSAENTPLLQGDLFDDLGYRAMTSAGDKILQGAYDTSQLDDGTQMFLSEVKIPPSILAVDPVQAYISPSDHREYWNKARESTQSSLSNMDFSFYKTVVQDDELNEITSRFIDIPFRSGYTPLRWRKSLNVHIMKKENDFRPEKQRTIHLIEASFSEGAKVIFSRRMMKNARLRKVIPEDQYARKGGRAIEAVLQKVLFFDYLRATRLSGVIVANDMHSCYDRMVHSATSLALRSLGAPAPAVECMSGVIQSMEHYIRTAYGDSDKCYGGSHKSPLQGGGARQSCSPPHVDCLDNCFLKNSEFI